MLTVSSQVEYLTTYNSQVFSKLCVLLQLQELMLP